MLSKPLLERPDLVIFDLDGTLTEESRALSRLTTSRAAEATLAHLLKVSGNSYLSLKEKGLLQKIPLERLKDTFLDQVARPRIGIRRTMEILRKIDIPTALLSNNHEHPWGEKTLERLGLTNSFQIRLFAESLFPKHQKPSQEGLDYIISTLVTQGHYIENIWMIGNSPHDMQAAMEASNLHPDKKITPIAIGELSGAAIFLSTFLNNSGVIASGFEDLLNTMQDLFCEVPN